MRKVIKFGCLLPLGLIVLLVLVGIGWVWIGSATADMKRPAISLDTTAYKLSVATDSLRICQGNTLLRNPYGLWEMRIGGGAVERGALQGAMGKDLLHHQEDAFVTQIQRMIPSEAYLGLLRRLTLFFNRRIADYIPLEYRTEIAALAEYGSHDFDQFGTPYERQLNYHAAHDIGHAMQSYMLVGCSSFAVWDGHSADSTLLVGRNFDFYVGEEFAANKVISIVSPDEGYRYVSVGWPGMIGVVSGMNEAGLTVTINAAKGPLPLRSAMPVSILARQILQYAATVEEARKLAAQATTFVAESFLITEARGRRAAIIEKTPAQQAVFTPDSTAEEVICTNHYQAAEWANDPINQENIATTDSKYRYRRLAELLARHAPLDASSAATILRDRLGLHGTSIGLTNEKALNQCLAHHSVIFMPEHRLMWVSTTPWQCGAYVCYDLNRVFDQPQPGPNGFSDASRLIAPDSLFLQQEYPRVLAYRRHAHVLRQAIAHETPVAREVLDSLRNENPDFYETYALLGDYYLSRGETTAAVQCWQQALTCEIPRQEQRHTLEKKIQRHDTK